MAGAQSCKIGTSAEDVAAGRLVARGWRILGRNIRVGRLEVDIVAVDPGPPGRLVAVEVRYRTRRDYGTAEESFDMRKRARTRTALMAIRSAGRLADGTPVPRLSPAVDLIVVEPRPGPVVGVRMRHHRDVLA